MNKQNIRKFLHFGYLPVETDKYPFEVDKISLMDLPENKNDLKKLAHQFLEQAIAKNISLKNLWVPLSGGVDSRVILAELFNQADIEQIQTITFGIPGNLDVELPDKLTRSLGIKHQFINLLDYDFSEDNLVGFASEMVQPTQLLDAYCSSSIFRDSEALYFSGFIGDRITGSVPSHLRSIELFNSAKIEFLNTNRIDQTGILPTLQISDLDIEDDSYSFLSPYEKLDYKIRQVNMTEPIVIGKRSNVCTPLTDPEFVSFFYSIALKYRQNQSLFFEMAADYYPEFFKIGLKNLYGAAIQSSSFRKDINRKYYYGRRILNRKFPSLHIQDPIHNYVDPYWFFVKNKSTAALTAKTISDLSKRSLLTDINPTLVLKKVQKGEMKFKNALEVLFNLELYLKAGVFE